MHPKFKLASLSAGEGKEGREQKELVAVTQETKERKRKTEDTQGEFALLDQSRQDVKGCSDHPERGPAGDCQLNASPGAAAAIHPQVARGLR